MNTEEADGDGRHFDHGSIEQMQDPYPGYARLRARCPVARAEKYGGFSLVAQYEDVRRVLSDHTEFSATSGTGIPPVPFQMCPTDIDPPEQTQYRKVLNSRFTKQSVEILRPSIASHTDKLIDEFVEAGHADLATQLVRPLLPKIILPLVGVPYKDHELISKWAEFLSHKRGTDLEGCERVSVELRQYLLKLISKRRHAEPSDDLLGLLLRGLGGRELDDEEVFGAVMILLFGGLDTTSAVLLEALLFLHREPRVRDRLMREREIWPAAIEEFVRFSSPVQGVTRLVVSDHATVSDVLLPRNTIVMALIASANRDETKFPSPDRCIIDRPKSLHLGFGFGPHLCLGRNLARLETEVVLQAILTRLPDYDVEDGFVPRYSPSEVRGMLNLPVRFTAGNRLSAA